MKNIKKLLYLILSFAIFIFISSCSNKNIDINIIQDINITLGDTYKINYELNGDYDLSFLSSDDSIVTVDDTGLIRSVSVGNAVITLSIDKENIKKTINVKVNKKETKNLEYGFYKIKEDISDLSFIEGYPWINTAVEGVLNKIEKPSEKDDYFASVNYEKLKDLKVPENKTKTGGLIYEADIFTDNRLKKIINESSTLSIIKNKIYNGASDEIKEEINKINNFSDNELKNYLSSKELFHDELGLITFVNEDLGPIIDFACDTDNPGFFILYILKQDSNLDDLKNMIVKMAEAFGITTVTSDFVSGVVDTFKSIVDDIPNPDLVKTTIGSLDETFNGMYDIESSFNDIGFDDNEAISYNSNIKDLYDAFEEEGTSFIKSLITISKIISNVRFIGAEKYLSLYKELLSSNGYKDERITDYITADDLSYYFVKKYYPEVVSKDYIKRYVKIEEKNKIDKLITDVISEYKILLSNNTWLSSETKLKAVEKLESMKYIAFYDDKFDDVADFTSTNTNPIAITGDYSYYYYDILHDNQLDMTFIHKFPLFTVNAAYYASCNTFIICHGLVAKILGEDKPIEFLYGSIGATIGHEISHGFDATGSNYDKDGNYSNWWTEEDRNTFNEKVDKLVDYYILNLRAFSDYPLDGDNMKGEIIADLGGIKVATLLGEKIEGFDFKKMYEAFASFFGFIYKMDSAIESITEDEHPLSYLRVNVTLSQQEKFREIYGIEEKMVCIYQMNMI